MRTGLAAGSFVLAAVLLGAVIPAVKYGYPLALLPLLAAGPTAARGLVGRRMLAASLLAG